AVGCLLLLATLSGCAARLVDFALDEEALYDQPIDEVWPQVRNYFQVNGFAFRETPGAAQLETEWREEFAGSGGAGYWHRYLVTARPEGPHRCKLIVTRDTRSVNKALAPAGSELSWHVDGRTEDNPNGFGSDENQLQQSLRVTGDNAIVGNSQQTG